MLTFWTLSEIHSGSLPCIVGLLLERERTQLPQKAVFSLIAQQRSSAMSVDLYTEGIGNSNKNRCTSSQRRHNLSIGPGNLGCLATKEPVRSRLAVVPQNYCPMHLVVVPQNYHTMHLAVVHQNYPTILLGSATCFKDATTITRAEFKDPLISGNKRIG